VISDEKTIKFEYRNPKFETNSNDQNYNDRNRKGRRQETEYRSQEKRKGKSGKSREGWEAGELRMKLKDLNYKTSVLSVSWFVVVK
jgi:hypothetical protein